MRGNQPHLTAQGKAAPTAPPAAHPLLEPCPRPSGMPPAQHAKLLELCGRRTLDVLLHLPRTLLDRSSTATIANAVAGERSTLVVQVAKRGPLPPRGSKRPLAIELADASGTLRAIFFNPQSWLERAFPVGSDVIISGKIETDPK
ncbi:MAG: hypothetical protein INF43_01630, partial [Alphaproteobacteria bacterium]|nr:hypothetical protein [Alphaproteobacteria bacterium]